VTVPVGGLRARLIQASLYNYVKDGVTARGWTNTGRRHTPFHFIPQPQEWDQEVPLNSIAVSAEDVFDQEAEMGSQLTDDTWTYYVDIYAEGEAVGQDVAHDVRDMLRGKLPSIDMGVQSFPVWDYRMPTPVMLFTCEISNVISDRARNFPQAWRRFWFSVRCDITDSYETELDAVFEGGDWDGGFPDDDTSGETIFEGGEP
jgi:hypothetical protein